MSLLDHPFPFDPSYGYKREALLNIAAPPAPPDFESFWRERYRKVTQCSPKVVIQSSSFVHNGYQVFDFSFESTYGATIQGWLLVPFEQEILRGLVIGHGYGGRDAPDFELGLDNTVLLFPCFRGLSRSASPEIDSQPSKHILHNIDQRDHYILGQCVDDLWLSVSMLLELYPFLHGKTAYMGISYGGGIGALAVPWDERIDKICLNVPSFGHHPLRLQLPTFGSAEAVQNYAKNHAGVMEVLQYYDAAVSAHYAKQMLLAALAEFDPAVAPPGQYAIYNAWLGPKKLFPLLAGHFAYPGQAQCELDLICELRRFFV